VAGAPGDAVPCSGTPPRPRHPGEDGVTGGGRVEGSWAHREVAGESGGGVGGALRGGRGPGFRSSKGARGPKSSMKKITSVHHGFQSDSCDAPSF